MADVGVKACLKINNKFLSHWVFIDLLSVPINCEPFSEKPVLLVRVDLSWRPCSSKK